MSGSALADRNTSLLLRTLTIWRGIFSLLAVSVCTFLWMADAEKPILWQKILLSLVLLVAAVFSAISINKINNRNHTGRLISLVIDYLAFLASVVIVLNEGQVFNGLDALADRFGRGIPFLGIVFAGYLVTALTDHFSKRPEVVGQLKQVGKWIILTGLLLFFWRVDGIQGLGFILKSLIKPLGLAAVISSLVFGSALWAMWREKTAIAMGARVHDEQVINGWLFLSPNLLGFLIFFAGPLLLSFYFAFTNSDAFNPPQWVGLANFAKILNIKLAFLQSPTQLAKEVVDITVYDEVGRLQFGNGGLLFAAADKLFWLALRNTLTFALFAVPLSVIPALVLSNILNSKLPGMKFFRAVYFMPSIAAIVGISLVWQWLYNATIGFINYFITVGIQFWNTLFNAGVLDPKIQWTSDEKTALMAVIIIAAWQTMGFNTVLFLAGLQNIPGELYEAATVDGAGKWNKFWSITIPMLAPTTFYVVSITTIQAMQVFEQVFILMNPAEGPNNSTITLVLYLYRSGFQNFKQGYASAIAWILFIVIFGITLFQFQQQRKSSIYES